MKRDENLERIVFVAAFRPHTAERPRLMPLEVDELPESLMVPGGAPRIVIPPTPPPPEIRSPVVQSPVALSPPPPPTPRAPTPRPQTPVVVKSEDLYVYASRDEALSQTSALNKRKEPVIRMHEFYAGQSCIDLLARAEMDGRWRPFVY